MLFRSAAGALAGDPTDQRCTRSQFDRASSLLAQASTNYEPDIFAKASGHPDWDATCWHYDTGMTQVLSLMPTHLDGRSQFRLSE